MFFGAMAGLAGTVSVSAQSRPPPPTKVTPLTNMRVFAGSVDTLKDHDGPDVGTKIHRVGADIPSQRDPRVDHGTTELARWLRP